MVEDGKKDDYLSGNPHRHYVVKGTFGISRGYEYRIIALAYNSQEKSPYPQYQANNVVTTEMLNLKKVLHFRSSRPRLRVIWSMKTEPTPPTTGLTI